jgi:hypothetical protein
VFEVLRLPPQDVTLALFGQRRLEDIPMLIRWRGLELPSRVVRDEAVSTNSYGRFVIEPFEQGFGTTIGNSLRRVLLSSLEGAAVTTVRSPACRTSLPAWKAYSKM